jgi:hypothetical protein
VAGASAAAARHHPVALLMCGLIAAVYALGLLELRRLRAATRGLHAALAEPPGADLAAWLARVPAVLRPALQQQLQGHLRSALPGAALAPALAGLLVLLGMLGTFIGLLLTLGGTANALAATADLHTLRDALAAPVHSLGLAFACSVAGVAGSAALGLLTALARRERAAVAQQLAGALGPDGALWPHTAACRQAQARQQEREAAQAAQQALLDRMTAFAGDLAAQLAIQQQRFHEQALQSHQALVDTVQRQLQSSLADSARLAGEALQLAAQTAARHTLEGIAREATALHERVGEQVAAHLTTLGQRLDTGLQAWQAGGQTLLQQLAAHGERQASTQQQHLAALADRSHQGLAALAGATEQRLATLVLQTEQGLAALTQALATQATALMSQLDQVQRAQAGAWAEADTHRLALWQASLHQAGEAQAARHRQLADELAQTTRALVTEADTRSRAALAETGALLQAAGEAPRAAVEVVAALREQLAEAAAQDRNLLAERAELMQTLHMLLGTLQQAAGEQRAAIDALVDGTSRQLGALGEQLRAQVASHGAQVREAAGHLAGSAAELGALGEGFGAAVQSFQGSNALLLQHLDGLQTALAGVVTRSDEQLGYYVVQARELIELCLGSQKQVLDELRRLQHQQTEATAHG